MMRHGGRSPSPVVKGVPRLRPIEIPRTDLRNRPIRVVADAEQVTAYGWGGRSASVSRAEIAGFGAYYHVVPSARGGRRTFSGVLVLDTDSRVLLRVTGRWKPGEAVAFAKLAGLPALTGVGTLKAIHAQLRRRAPGYRKVRARSRLIGCWYALLLLLFFVAPPVAEVNVSDGYGWFGFVGSFVATYLFWYLVAFRVPRLTRWLWRRWPVADAVKTGANSGGSTAG